MQVTSVLGKVVTHLLLLHFRLARDETWFSVLAGLLSAAAKQADTSTAMKPSENYHQYGNLCQKRGN